MGSIGLFESAASSANGENSVFPAFDNFLRRYGFRFGRCLLKGFPGCGPRAKISTPPRNKNIRMVDGSVFSSIVLYKKILVPGFIFRRIFNKPPLNKNIRMVAVFGLEHYFNMYKQILLYMFHFQQKSSKKRSIENKFALSSR